MMRITGLLLISLAAVCSRPAAAQELVVVRPVESDEVLVNPGIGFMTFQRFNGDALNLQKKWTEGYPIVYQPFDGDLTNKDYPLTSLAYFRIYWKFVEPQKGQFNWQLIDRALETAKERGQTLLLRIAPYGTDGDNDVPDWYRTMVGPEKGLPVKKWRTDPEDPRYAKAFGAMVRALGARYDGDPRLESVDLSIVGAWGEGAGSAELTDKTRKALVDAYLDGFKKTHLLMLLTDEKTNKYGLSQRAVGWRVDCLGDLGGFSKTWCHMYDLYPQTIIKFGMKDAWKHAPVSFEVCWVMQHWKDMGWDVDYIIDQSLKWHISSFNGKSSAVPAEWWPQVNRWLKRMGYRFVLRKFTYPATLNPGGKLQFTSWWENTGVAPCYHPFRLALRLKNKKHSVVVPLEADIREWLPGDIVCDGSVDVPADLAPGQYDVDIGLLDPGADQPRVQLAIKGRTTDGWYRMGTVTIPLRVRRSTNEENSTQRCRERRGVEDLASGQSVAFVYTLSLCVFHSPISASLRLCVRFLFQGANGLTTVRDWQAKRRRCNAEERRAQRASAAGMAKRWASKCAAGHVPSMQWPPAARQPRQRRSGTVETADRESNTKQSCLELLEVTVTCTSTCESCSPC